WGHRASVERRRARPASGRLALGAGRTLQPLHRHGADAISRALAAAGRGAKAQEHERLAGPGGRSDRLRIRGGVLARLQEEIRQRAGDLAARLIARARSLRKEAGLLFKT